MAEDYINVRMRLRDARKFAADADMDAAAVRRLGNATEAAGRKSKATSIATAGLSKTWGFMAATAKRGALAMGLGLGFVAKAGLSFNSTMEQNTVSFTHFLGSTQAAHKYLDQLYNLAATTPFEFKDVATATKQMLAFGFGAQEAVKDLRTIGDTASGLGTGTEGINRMVLALGQMKVAGVVQGDELRQFQEAGVNVYKYMIAAGLITKDDIGQIGKLHLDAGKAIDAIMKGMQKDFGGLSAQQAKTWQGQLSTMKDYASQAAGALTQPIFDLLKSKAFPTINATLQKLANWARGGGVTRATGALAAGFQATDASQVQGYTGFAGKAAKAGLFLRKVWKQAQPVLADLLVLFKGLLRELKPLAVIMAGALYVGWKLFGGVLHFVAHNMGILGPLAVSLLAGIMAYKAIWTVVGIVMKLRNAFILLRLTIATNPATVFIAALIAVAIGLIYAYKRVKWFHNAVDAVFGWIKSHWPLLLAILSGPIGLAVYAIVKNFDKIKSAASAVWDFIKKLFSAGGDILKGVFTAPINAVFDLLRGIHIHIGKIKKLGVTLFGGIDFSPFSFLPHLAEGGVFARGGLALVGEQGPEIASFPTGASIHPLQSGMMSKVDSVNLGSLTGDRERTTIIPVSLDGKVITEVVAKHTADRMASR